MPCEHICIWLELYPEHELFIRIQSFLALYNDGLMVVCVYRMLPAKLLLSYKDLLILLLETTVMGILLHLYWLIKWELHRYSSFVICLLIC